MAVTYNQFTICIMSHTAYCGTNFTPSSNVFRWFQFHYKSLRHMVHSFCVVLKSLEMQPLPEKSPLLTVCIIQWAMVAQNNIHTEHIQQCISQLPISQLANIYSLLMIGQATVFGAMTAQETHAYDSQWFIYDKQNQLNTNFLMSSRSMCQSCLSDGTTPHISGWMI